VSRQVANGEDDERDNRHSLPVTEQNPGKRHTRPEGVSDIRALTGLRGVAAMMVVAYHFWPRTDIPTNWLKWTVGRGYLWVDLFFVLSGYVISLNYGRLFAQGFSGTAFAGFLVRRLARIYPLYIVVLGAQIIYTIATHGGFQDTEAWAAVKVTHPALDVPANVLLVQSLGVSPSIIIQAWSISTEFAAYLCFPIFVAWVLSATWRGVTLGGVVAMTLLTVVAATVTHDGAWHSGPLDAYDSTHFAPLMRAWGDSCWEC